MRSIRKHVFETNSSSEHCVSVSNELRTADEFPKLTDNGVLEIEARIKWECGQPGTTTDSVRDILDYFCMLAYNLYPWEASEESIKKLHKEAFNDVLETARLAYEKVGLEQPKAIFYYYTDVDGNKYRYDGQFDGIDKIWAPDGAGIIECITGDKWDEYYKDAFDQYAKDHPDRFAKCIRTKYPFGINHNLTYGSFDDVSFEEGYCSEESYGLDDLLQKRFTLTFYRT